MYIHIESNHQNRMAFITRIFSPPVTFVLSNALAADDHPSLSVTSRRKCSPSWTIHWVGYPKNGCNS